MRFGCCGSLVAAGPDRTGVEIAEQIAALGYDYIELPLAEMMALSDGEFAALRRRVAASGLRCETCNNFFPASLRLTGAEADPARISGLYEGELARRGWWRTYPSSPDEWDYGAFVQAVKDCGYDGRVSLEAPAPAFARQAGEALDVLHTLFG